jgi:hypothetical protein
MPDVAGPPVQVVDVVAGGPVDDDVLRRVEVGARVAGGAGDTVRRGQRPFVVGGVVGAGPVHDMDVFVLAAVDDVMGAGRRVEVPHRGAGGGR